MAKRMSNRERIEKAALESAAAEAEKKEKKASKARVKSEKKPTPSGARRQKIVWKVLDSTFKEIAEFPFPEKSAAEAEAAKRTEKSGRDHFVSRAEVPMEDDE